MTEGPTIQSTPIPSTEAWDAIWASCNCKIEPPPPALVQAAILYERDGWYTPQIQRLCDLYRKPIDHA